MATSDELLKQMYDNDLASKKAALESDYKAALSDLDAQKAQNAKNADANVRLTKTEADRSAANAAEYYNAAGLSTGARAQARMAAENQLLADLTAVRAAQQQADADAERQRGLLSQKYAAAIRQAQADNDMAKAQALYEAAKAEEERIRREQQEEFDRKWTYAVWLAEEMGDDSLLKELTYPEASQTTSPTTFTGYVPTGSLKPRTGNGSAIFSTFPRESTRAQQPATEGGTSPVTMNSIVNLGGSLTPEDVAKMVAAGLVIETTDENGNTIFVKNPSLGAKPSFGIFPSN